MGLGVFGIKEMGQKRCLMERYMILNLLKTIK